MGIGIWRPDGGGLVRGRTPAPAYRPEIDGLRAVAIVPVVLFHARIPGFGAGFVGVDVFFVISGYLITRLLLRDIDGGAIRYAHFYERRARRIVPALIPVLLATLLAAWWTMIPHDFRHFGRSLATAAVFLSNFWFMLRADYFFAEESLTPLLHTWSLSVEEQFYLLYPVSLALLAAKWRRAMLPVLIAAAVVSAALYFGILDWHPDWAFFLLPTRIWELMAGAIAALVAAPRRGREALALLGLVLVASGFFLIGRDSPLPGPVILMPVVGSFLILVCGEGTRLTARMLSWRPVVTIGLISYGTYLWHMPLLALARYHWLGFMPIETRVSIAAAGFALGWLSYRTIELPVRTGRLLVTRGALAAACLGGLGLAAAFGAAAAYRWLPAPDGLIWPRELGRYAGEDLPEVVTPAGTGLLPFVLYGDSHARQLFPSFSEEFGDGALDSANGCVSLPGLRNVPPGPQAKWCRDHLEEFRLLVDTRGTRMVVAAHLWNRFVWNDAGTLDGNTEIEDAPDALVASLERLKAMVPGDTRLVIVGHVPGGRPPEHPGMARGYLRCTKYRNVECPPAIPRSMGEGNKVNRALATFAARHPEVIYIDPADLLCRDGKCPIFDGKTAYYSDENHLTDTAGRVIARHLQDLLAVADGRRGRLPSGPPPPSRSPNP